MSEPFGVPRPDWTPVPRDGCLNVESKVLLALEGLVVAMLKFDAEGTIDEHDAPHDIDVVCLEGEGFVSVEDRVHEFHAGQSIRWPARLLHRIWTGDRSMVTLMVEHPRRGRGRAHGDRT